MKRIYILFFIASFFASGLFGYSISKDYDGNLIWDYEILATNESLYSTNADGEKVFSHTLLIRDSKSKINYVIYCDTETDTLKAYYEYINKYQTIKDIKEKLLPELQKKVSGYSSSDSGTWMFCYVDEKIDSYYSNIPNDILEELFYERATTGVFDKETLFYLTCSLFEDEGELWQFIFDADEKFETEYDLYKFLINSICEECETEDNIEKIESIRSELFKIIEAAEKAEEE